ncbi:hypothetical protein [Archangium sp.]|uniref:hypothetical protein n=1 Tax=Archangium sp. TaxID=1872627 RepID=UPI00286D4804|nr:hypothetical protein [Archangium sp.]
MPVTDTTYRLVLAHAPELLSLLPPRPELVATIEGDRRWAEFVHETFVGELERARALMDDDVRRRINILTRLSAGLGEMAPLHYAARRADVNALAGNGKSASRLVAETATVEDATRREAIRYLESVGGRFVPEVDGWWRRFWVRRGAWLSP